MNVTRGWGETFSRTEVETMLASAGLTVAAVEDPGTQYFVVTAFKGPAPDRRTYFLPGEPEDGGWRPVAPQSTIQLHAAAATGLYVGIYFWPADPLREHTVRMTVNGVDLGTRDRAGPGRSLFGMACRCQRYDRNPDGHRSTL
ncbi:MAG: hypothetical protein WDO18_14390 [Acidobacteriota bacterium]